MFFSQIQFFIIAMISIAWGYMIFDFGDNNTFIYTLIIICIWVWMWYVLLFQYCLTREKVSVLQPYSNLDKIFTIILGYILFSDSSMITFGVSLFAFMVLIFSSVDIKSFKLSKTLFYFLICNIFGALRMIIIGYLLLSMSSFNLVSLYALIFIGWLFIFLWFTGSLKNFAVNSKQFYLYRIGATFTFGIYYFISIFLIQELGIVLTNLVSLVSLWATLIIGYFMLHDTPSKKDITLSIIVVWLIGVGFYFK